MEFNARPPCPFFGFRLSPGLRTMRDEYSVRCALARESDVPCLYVLENNGPNWLDCHKRREKYNILLVDVLRLSTTVYPAEAPDGVPFNAFTARVLANGLINKEGAE